MYISCNVGFNEYFASGLELLFSEMGLFCNDVYYSTLQSILDLNRILFNKLDQLTEGMIQSILSKSLKC